MAGIGLNRSRQAPAENTPSFGAIAERFRRAGDLDRAIALCQEGLRKFPNQLSARVTLGWALLDKGEYEQARQELERVIRRAPDNLAAIRGLAELHDRAEHTVTGLGPDGAWATPEEPSDEQVADVPTDVSAFEMVDAGGESAPAAAVAASEAAWAEPLPPLQVSVPTSDVDPQSLIETPAQAAVAHAAPGQDEPLFEDVVRRAGDDVVHHAADAAVPEPEMAAEVPAAPAHEPAPQVAEFAEAVEPDVVGPPEPAPVETVLSTRDAAETLEAAARWEDFEQPEPAAVDLDPAPVLFAENAEADLARMASELAAEATEPVADVVLDLPAESGLEDAFEPFEASAADLSPSDAVELVAADAALDPDLPLAFEEQEPALPVVDSAEVVTLQVDSIDPDADSGQEARNWAGLTLVESSGVEPVDEPEPNLVLESSSLEEVAEAPAPDLTLAAEAVAAIEGIGHDAPLDEPAPEPVLAAAPEPVLAAEPEPVMAAEAEPVVAAELEPVDGEASSPSAIETAAVAAEPEVAAVAAEPSIEPAAEAPDVSVALDQPAIEAVPSIHVEHVEESQPAWAAASEPEQAREPEPELSPEPEQDVPAQGQHVDVEVPAVAAMADAAAQGRPDVEIEPEVAPSAALAALVADSIPEPPGPVPEAAPDLLQPAAAASLREVPGGRGSAAARADTPEPAPVAALEGFLRKISARRLHLTPGSVA